MLNCVIRICEEGPPLDKFEATSALKQFMETKDRRPFQSVRKSYKPREKDNRVETLADVPLSDDQDDLLDDDMDLEFDEVIVYED